MTTNNILIVYPEDNKTRIAVLKNVEPVFLKSIVHDQKALDKFSDPYDQKAYRMKALLDELEKNNFDIRFDTPGVGRGL